MASWWERDPAALDAEIKELTDAGFRVRRDTAPGARAALSVERDKDTYRVLYSHTTTRWGDRLVAFKPWPDPEVAVAGGTALESVQRLRDGGGLQVFSRSAGCVYVPEVLRTDISGAGGSLHLGHSRVTSGSYALRSLTGSRAALEVNEEQFLGAFPDDISGLWARGEVSTWVLSGTEVAVTSVEAIIARAHSLSIEDVRARSREMVLGLLPSRAGTSGRAEWLFVRRSQSGSPVVLRTQTWSTLDQADRAPFARRLAGKSVVLIGCGAVGWTVALELARSGVTKFVLYDDDLVHPYNLPRLATHLGAAGRFKVDVLAEQIESIAPGIEVRARPVEVGLHVGTAALVADQPDLLINLTGEEISTDETNAASLILGRPAVYGWISNGVLAGRIIRVRPGESACYDCVREAAPGPIRTSGPVPTIPEHAWTGASFNVDAFACALARTAVLTLAGEAVSERNPDHAVLDFAGVVPSARNLRFRRDPRCRWCA